MQSWNTPTNKVSVLFYGKENGKKNNESFDNLHIVWLIHVYALSKNVKLNGKHRLENWRGSTTEVAMLADVSESHGLFWVFFSNVWLGPSDMSLRHSLWMCSNLISQ